MKGGTSIWHFLSRGRTKILKLGKYPHRRADQFLLSYIFDWAHTGTYIGEKYVCWAIFKRFCSGRLINEEVVKMKHRDGFSIEFGDIWCSNINNHEA